MKKYMLVVLLLLLAVLKIIDFVRRKSRENSGVESSDHRSFNEILLDAPVKQLFREKESVISKSMDNDSLIRDLLMPFASEYKIPLRDIFIINKYLEVDAGAGKSSGMERLRGTCSDYLKGIVFVESEDGFFVLKMKDIY